MLRIGGRDTAQKIGQERLTLRDDVTFTEFAWHGDHVIKVGGNFEQLEYTVAEASQQDNRCSASAPDIGARIPVRGAVRHRQSRPLRRATTQYGLYVQDDWSIDPALTFNLGLRWDYETDMLDKDYVTPADVRAAAAPIVPATLLHRRQRPEASPT